MKKTHLITFLQDATFQEKIELLTLMQKVQENAVDNDTHEITVNIIYNILHDIFPKPDFTHVINAIKTKSNG